MKGSVIAEDGSGVNYAALKSSSLYAEYKKHAMELQKLDLSALNEKEKMAFFISILYFSLYEGKQFDAKIGKGTRIQELYTEWI